MIVRSDNSTISVRGASIPAEHFRKDRISFAWAIAADLVLWAVIVALAIVIFD